MKTEPKIGERVAWDNVRYRCYESLDCPACDMLRLPVVCGMVECRGMCRQDGKSVIFIREGHYGRKELNEILGKGRKA